MPLIRLQQSGELYLHDGVWKVRWCQEAIDAAGIFVERRWCEPAVVGPATGPHGVNEKEAQHIALRSVVYKTPPGENPPHPGMTITGFVERVFVKEHVATKAASGRTHFQAILKHVLKPEEVQRVFEADSQGSKVKMKTIPDWPYLGNMPLSETRTGDVQRLIEAAVARGYSAQTVKHIRNVVAAIFAHAKKRQCFHGDNPATQVVLPKMVRKEAHALTFAQAKDLLGAMEYPQRELALIAILTHMNVAEICGLQWKWVNLTDDWCMAEGERIPPRTIAVRRHFYRGELVSLPMKSRNRYLSIPEPLLEVLRGLRQRQRYTGPDDFVLASRVGTPVNQQDIAKRRLKPIGKTMKMPWLSWRVLSRTHTTLAHELGMRSLGGMAMPTSSHPGVVPCPLDKVAKASSNRNFLAPAGAS
jgi:integrase